MLAGEGVFTLGGIDDARLWGKEVKEGRDL